MMWKAGPQPDQIVDAEGNHVGFADAGWAQQIIKMHNEVVKTLVTSKDVSVILSGSYAETMQKQCRKEEALDPHISQYKQSHKNSK